MTAVPNSSGKIRIEEQGIEVAHSQVPTGSTEGLIFGVAEYLGAWQGFDLTVESDIPIGAGLSSSAAFEVAVGKILMPNATPLMLAKAGQYAETKYLGKACGLMDQLICAVGGVAMLDFENPDAPLITPLTLDWGTLGLSVVIVNTGGSHSDLTAEYSAIPQEMKEVAETFGKSVLREVDEQEFYSTIPKLRCSDRAILRAMHFFAENKRVFALANAIQQNDSARIIDLIRQSGESSVKLLQNISATPEQQPLMLALATAERILGSNGAARVHGGGFAGGILAVMRSEFEAEFIAKIGGPTNVITSH